MRRSLTVPVAKASKVKPETAGGIGHRKTNNDRAGLQVGAAGGAVRRQTNLPRGGHCDRGSRSAGGTTGKPCRLSPLGPFLPKLQTPADTTLSRRGIRQGTDELFHAVISARASRAFNG